MTIRPVRTFVNAVCVAAIIACIAAPIALAAGTGDDPTPTKDVLTPREAAVKARLERTTDATLLKDSKAAAPGGAVVPLAMADVPYYYMWTPSHKQERNYWCGPATCQVLDDTFGNYVSQSTYAAYMGTTTNGTDFTKVDDALRYFTGQDYFYFGPLTESLFFYHVADSLMNHHTPLATDLNIIASVWPQYVKDHPGHIVPIEAFDWRVWTIRLNDVFDESASGGGATYGHITYNKSIVWNGVYNHFRRAVVCAP